MAGVSCVDPSLSPFAPRLIETSLPPFINDNGADARPCHNSLTTDQKTPTVPGSTVLSGSAGNKDAEAATDILIPVYSVYVWPYLLGCLRTA
mgnify:CR=1 FL=1